MSVLSGSFRWPSSGAVSSPVSAPLVVVPALALVDTPRTYLTYNYSCPVYMPYVPNERHLVASRARYRAPLATARLPPLRSSPPPPFLAAVPFAAVRLRFESSLRLCVSRALSGHETRGVNCGVFRLFLEKLETPLSCFQEKSWLFCLHRVLQLVPGIKKPLH